MGEWVRLDLLGLYGVWVSRKVVVLIYSSNFRGKCIAIKSQCVICVTMFEDQTQRIYENLSDKFNNFFIKKPFLATSVVSIAACLLLLTALSGYKKTDASVQISGYNKNLSLAEDNDSGSYEGLKESSQDVIGSEEIKVDLAGAVKNPGLYTLKKGSRLGDLLSMAGGFVSEASALWVSKNLNLSQVIYDRQKIYIPFDWDLDKLAEGGGVRALSLGVTDDVIQRNKIAKELSKMQVVTESSNSGKSSNYDSGNKSEEDSGDVPTESTEQESDSDSNLASLINVNTATASQLDTLPGIGKVYAARIIENRPYDSYDDFKSKSGLSAKLCESLKNLITF